MATKRKSPRGVPGGVHKKCRELLKQEIALLQTMTEMSLERLVDVQTEVHAYLKSTELDFNSPARYRIDAKMKEWGWSR